MSNFGRTGVVLTSLTKWNQIWLMISRNSCQRLFPDIHQQSQCCWVHTYTNYSKLEKKNWNFESQIDTLIIIEQNNAALFNLIDFTKFFLALFFFEFFSTLIDMCGTITRGRGDSSSSSSVHPPRLKTAVFVFKFCILATHTNSAHSKRLMAYSRLS